MKEELYSEENLIGMIRVKKKEKEDAIRWIIRNFSEPVWKTAKQMGGKEDDAQNLFTKALTELVRDIELELYPDQKNTIGNYLIEKIKQEWCERLSMENPKQRRQIFTYIAADEDLKKRTIWQLKDLGCTKQEAEGFYNEGFLKLDELFKKKAYQGGDIKGFFKKVCYNLKRNNRRKSLPQLPGELPETKFSNDMEKKIERNNHHEILNTWLAKLTEKCRKTLLMWNEGYSYEEIAKELDYKNKENASLSRFRCMQKLMSFVDL